MDYNRAGRKLGTGMRVLGRIAGQRLEQAGAPPTAEQQARARAAAEAARASTAQQTSRVREGGRRFGRSFFLPLKRAGHSLTLEIAGVFFALFAAWFVINAWQLRANLYSGQQHTRLLIYLALAAVFTYFTVSSFLRARRAGRAR